MPVVITSLCLRDGSCIKVCPADCIVPGKPAEKYPHYYVDMDACIDCGACIPECPLGAVFWVEKLPTAYKSKKVSHVSMPVGTPGYTEVYDGKNRDGEPVHLEATRTLQPGETIDLTPAKQSNKDYFTSGPGYSILDS